MRTKAKQNIVCLAKECGRAFSSCLNVENEKTHVFPSSLWNWLFQFKHLHLSVLCFKSNLKQHQCAGDREWFRRMCAGTCRGHKGEFSLEFCQVYGHCLEEDLWRFALQKRSLGGSQIAIPPKRLKTGHATRVSRTNPLHGYEQRKRCWGAWPWACSGTLDL